MKETQFIRQNKQNWQLLEERLRQHGKKHTKATSKDGADLLLKVTDDLSYAQTHFKRRSIRLYLNSLSATAFSQIYAVRIKKHNAFRKFWLEELPDTFYRFRQALGASALLFFIAVLIGIFSVLSFPEFAEVILGRSYISMTEENIAKGDPMAVYKKENALEMFITIFTNNLQVAIITFIGGIFAGLGTVGILFRNGIMLGTFQFYFLRHDLLFESFLTIWQHGTTEICAIIIAGGAGLTVGKSILFPGTLPRGISFRLGVSNGLKILVGIAPVIFLAAIIESYLTRHDDIGTIAQLTIILFSLTFMVTYYVWLPYKRGQQFKESDFDEQKPPESQPMTFSLSTIFNGGDIVGTAIQWLQRFGGKILVLCLVMSFALTLGAVLFHNDLFSSLLGVNTQGSGNFFQNAILLIEFSIYKLAALKQTLQFSDYPLFFPLLIISLGYFQFKLAAHFTKQMFPVRTPSSIFRLLLPVTLWALALLPVFFWLDFYIVSLLIFGPIIGVATFVSQKEDLGFVAATRKTVNYLLSFPGKFLMIVGVVSLITCIMAFLSQSPLIYVAVELVNDFIGYTETKALLIIEFLVVALAYFTVFLGYALITVSFLFFFSSTQEIKEANDLKRRIQEIRKKKSAYGLQKTF